MADSVEEQFVREGIKRYGVARDTIQAFETLLQERLGEFLKSYTFTGLEPTQDPIKTGVQEQKDASWIWAIQPRVLSSKRDVSVEIGLGWRSAQVAYYCNLLDREFKVIDFSYSGGHPRVEPRLWSKSARLFMQAPNPVDLDADLKLLLDELMRAFT